MRPFGLGKKPTEKQDAQNHDYGDYDDLNQAHNDFLRLIPRTKDVNCKYSKIVPVNCQRTGAETAQDVYHPAQN